MDEDFYLDSYHEERFERWDDYNVYEERELLADYAYEATVDDYEDTLEDSDVFDELDF
tara:strand:- start:461 stop:634 length:174 start_codon:yes stop_codon:yes gene_type:complete